MRSPEFHELGISAAPAIRSGGAPGREGPVESSAAPGAPGNPCLGSINGSVPGMPARSGAMPRLFVGGGAAELLPLPAPTRWAIAGEAASAATSKTIVRSTVTMELSLPRDDRDSAPAVRATPAGHPARSRERASHNGVAKVSASTRSGAFEE